MISPQKVEWINFLTTNITLLGDNVYPSFSNIDRNADIFCTVEISILDNEDMVTGDMKYGYARLTFVAPNPKIMDHDLLDKFDDELKIKKEQFVTFTYGGISNVTESDKYEAEIEGLIKREVDIRMTWYESTNNG